MTLITFCIVHYKRLSCLKKCISSIERYTSVDYEIKLLRQGYQGEETESYLRLLEKKDNIEVMRIKRNIGCTPGRSLIVPKATTPFIMTLDNDVYVTKGWLEPILKIFENEKDVGIAGIPRYSLDGKFENIGGERLKVENGVIIRNKIKMPTNPKIGFLDAEHISSGTMVFREEVRKDFQFDSRFFVGFGDIDKDMQLLNSKWRKVVCLKSKVFHERLWKSDRGYYDFRRNWIEIARSYARFRKKWGVRLPFKEHTNYMLIRPMKYPFDIMYRRAVRRYPFTEDIIKTVKNLARIR